MKYIKTKTKEKVITTKTYVVELTEDEYNWLMSHPNFESYNYGSIWFGNNNHVVTTPYVGVQVKDCNYNNTVVSGGIYRNLTVTGTSYSNATLPVSGNSGINNEVSFVVKRA